MKFINEEVETSHGSAKTAQFLCTMELLVTKAEWQSNL